MNISGFINVASPHCLCFLYGNNTNNKTLSFLKPTVFTSVFSVLNLFLSPFPFLKHLPHFPPPQSSNEALSGPLLSRRTLWPPRFPYLKQPCCVMWRPIVCVSLPKLDPSSGLPHQSPCSKVTELLQRSWLSFRERRPTVEGGGSTGGRVQSFSLPPRGVPGGHPFMDTMCFHFFFCASLVN